MSEDRKSFWGELKERRVVRVGIVYIVVAWAVLQVADTITGILDVPDWAPQLVLMLLTLGFPVALVLAWAFQMTSAGVKRAEPISKGPGSRLPFVAGLAVGILAVSGVAFIFFGAELASDPGTRELDPNSVAVLPFRASTPEDLSYLGSGVMDLLAARLDGEVGPRSLDPGAVAAAAQLEASSDAVARNLGAGLVITGSVVGDASRIAITAELNDVIGGTLVASASAEGHPDSLTVLVDRLASQLLSLSAGESSESLASLTSASPQALRAYLSGRQAWRRGDYFDAVEFFDAALDDDSTFALAAIGRADAANMATGVGGAGAALDQARRHQDRLGTRDLIYLQARRPGVGRTQREAIEAYEQVTQELPDRIEGWYFLGENMMHQQLDPGPEWIERSAAAFERAMELDPEFYPALQHLMFIAAMSEDAAELEAVVRRMLELLPESGPYLRGLAEGRGVWDADVDGISEYTDPNDVILSPLWAILMPDQTPDDFIPFTEAAIESRKRRAVSTGELRDAILTEYRVQLALGRPSRAQAARERLIREFGATRLSRGTIDDALWDFGSIEDAEASVREIDRRLAGVSGAGLTASDAYDLSAAEVWRYVRDPSYNNRDAADVVRSVMIGTPHPAVLSVEASALILEAWSQTRAGDPAGAASIDRLYEITRQVAASGSIVLRIAALLEERGELDRALLMLEKRVRWSPYAEVYEPTVWRTEGRLATATGDTARAIRAYERYLKIRQDPELEVMPEVEAVRAALAELQGA